MANPKRKWSKARTSRHRSNWKLSVPNLVEDPVTKELRLPHKMCKVTGTYAGREVLNLNKTEE